MKADQQKQTNESLDDEALTPEEESQLAEAIKVSLVVIHGDGKTGDDIAKMVLESENVADGIGAAIATVLIIVSKHMEFSDDIKLLLAMEIFTELTTLAVDAGALAEDEINDPFIDRAVSKAYTNYITAKEAMGELDLDELRLSVEQAQAEGETLGIVPKAGQAPAQQSQPKPMNQAQGLLARASQQGGV